MKTSSTRLTQRSILAWADSFHRLYGFWPTIHCGPLEGIAGGEGLTWAAIDSALSDGRHGLRGGITLSQLLQRHRDFDPQRNRRRPALPRPRLSVPQVLRWVDAYVERYGRWPSVISGSVDPVVRHAETWRAVDEALRAGKRGLPGGLTLQQFMQQHRGKDGSSRKPFPSVQEILALVRREHERTGVWPRRSNNPVPGYPDLTWAAIDNMLRARGDDRRPHSTLAMLKSDHFGFRNHMRLPPLDVETVLAWADAHHRRHGRWPISKSTYEFKHLEEAPGEQWPMISRALRRGLRGLPRVGGLADLLMKRRGVRNKAKVPPLKVKQILAWADGYYHRTGDWPSRSSGAIPEAPGENWSAINQALVAAGRGLRTRSSLAKLLARHRMPMYARKGIRLTRIMILDWAARHHELTGELPTPDSGRVRDVPGETWAAIDASMRTASRGTRGMVSLADFLDEYYTPANPGGYEQLTIAQIISWARSFKHRVGRWPTRKSAYTDPTRVEKWSTIDVALREGLRGLPGGSSLAKLLRDYRRRGQAD